MIKKLLTFLLAVLLLFSLAACADNAEKDPPEPTLPSVPSEPSPESDAKMTATADSLGITAENYPRIDGSTSTFGIVWGLWNAMNKSGTAYYDENCPQTASKTVPSYHMLIGGDVDMILVPYASADVLAQAKAAGVELEFHKVAAEALIFITPAENPAENITREQLRSIYLDYGITNWSALGGPDKELVPICRNSDSGSQSQMDNLVLSGEAMHPDIEKNHVELTMEGMLEQVACYHNGGLNGTPTDSYALGYTLYTYLQNMTEATGIGDHLKILSYEGVPATEESIIDESYPLSDGYYAVVRSDLPADHAARQLIGWLQSPAGIDMIASHGLLPCR